ncbi:MAG: ankyrin repeat domain-containing protein [Candidatus Entotheonellia bacterium]
MHLAAMRGHAPVVQVLLRVGALAEATMLGGRTLWSSATPLELITVDGVTPLLAAAEAGHLQVVRLLVDAGADVNRADATGFTPLMGAVGAGHRKMVAYLLQRGARPDAVDVRGWTVQRHTTESRHPLPPILTFPLQGGRDEWELPSRRGEGIVKSNAVVKLRRTPMHGS